MRDRLRPYRLPEALIVAGFTFIGSVMAATDLSALLDKDLIVGLAASYLVIVSIYAFNSWAGFAEDIANPRLAAGGLASGRAYATVTAVTLAAALMIFAFLRPAAIPYATGVFFLWSFYSFPRYGAKYVPLAGTIVHVAVGIVQFQQGWALLGEPGARSFLLSLYFALILAAGHVNHELIDHDPDRASGIASGAVRFGVRRWTTLHLAIAIAALAALGVPALTDALPLSRLAPFLAASIGHVLSAASLFAGTTEQSRFLRHRSVYRILYAVAGLATLPGLWHA